VFGSHQLEQRPVLPRHEPVHNLLVQLRGNLTQEAVRAAWLMNGEAEGPEPQGYQSGGAGGGSDSTSRHIECLADPARVDPTRC